MLKAQSSAKYSEYERIKKIGEGTFATVYLGHAHIKKSLLDPSEKDGKESQTKTMTSNRKTDAKSNFVKIAIKRIKVGLFQGGPCCNTRFWLIKYYVLYVFLYLCRRIGHECR
jgi:serine/threonine protein kinase